MKTEISFSSPSQVESECLVAVVLDRSQNGTPNPSLQTSDKAVSAAAADLLSSGEVSGKIFESALIHRPQGLKAKRLLLVGGGKATNFSGYELRKLAGTAVRYLKPRSIRQFAFIAPEGWSGGKAADAVKAIVEGAFVGNFDPDTYKSDRKDQKIDSITVIASGDQSKLQKAMDEARIIGESQNFTRDLVNEPSNRMTPTILADRARKMAQETGLRVEVYGP